MEAREKVKQSSVFVCTFQGMSRPGGEKACLDDKSKSVFGNRMNESATTRRPQKVPAVASGGGHWMQLMRLVPALKGYEVIFVTVSDSYRSLVPENKFYAVRDANRWNKFLLVVHWRQEWRGS